MDLEPRSPSGPSYSPDPEATGSPELRTTYTPGEHERDIPSREREEVEVLRDELSGRDRPTTESEEPAR